MGQVIGPTSPLRAWVWKTGRLTLSTPWWCVWKFKQIRERKAAVRVDGAMEIANNDD